jgi:hypothetical protein
MAMTYRGRVKNGVIVLDEPRALPEGAEVQVVPLAEQAVPTLYDRYKDFIGSAKGLPEDASINVDHYLYGHPRQ